MTIYNSDRTDLTPPVVPRFMDGDGKNLFIAGYGPTNRIVVMNISDNSVVSITQLNFVPTGIKVFGNRCCVSSVDTIYIFDVSNPLNINLIGSLFIGYQIINYILYFNFLFLVLNNTLLVFDISNYSAPKNVYTFAESCSGAIKIFNKKIFFGSGVANSIIIYDVSNPSKPLISNVNNVSFSVGSVNVIGNYLYYTNPGLNFTVLCKLNQNVISEIVNISSSLGNATNWIVAWSRYLILCDGGGHNKIFDIYDASNSILINDLVQAYGFLSTYINGYTFWGGTVQGYVYKYNLQSPIDSISLSSPGSGFDVFTNRPYAPSLNHLNNFHRPVSLLGEYKS